MKLKHLQVLLLIMVFASCKKEKNEILTYNNDGHYTDPFTITNVFPEIIKAGDTLTIVGNDFIIPDYPTIEITYNNQTQQITPTNNELIKFKISNDTPTGSYQISFKRSNQVENKYIFVKGNKWYKTRILGSYIVKIKENSYNLLVGNSGSLNYQSFVTEYTLTKNGYTKIHPFIGFPSVRDAEYFDQNFALGVNIYAYYTKDNFATIDTVPISWTHPPFDVMLDQIIEINNDTFIVTNNIGTYLKYDITNNTIEYYYLDNANSVYITKHGKSSDGTYYGIGHDYIQGDFKIFVISSPNGFNDWDIINDDTLLNTYSINSSEITFIDDNLIFDINRNNELIMSNDLAETWQILDNNVSNFFAKNRNEWYKVKNNKLLHTIDAGNNWIEEMEFQTDETIFTMDFKDDKSVIGTSKHIYIKFD